MRRLAVVLFNLGGPDGPSAVRPFLFNLFNDPAILGAPQPLRWTLAATIAVLRARSARANYAIMGGGSPLLAETEKQAAAVIAALAERAPDVEARSFVAMRYWTPFVADAARAVAEFAPDEIVLLPLYPQFSTTTTGSSLRAWRGSYRGIGRTRAICCYPDATGLVAAHARLLEEVHRNAGSPDVRLLLSAHGLPESVVAKGDPYASQVEATASEVLAQLSGEWDAQVCYQSRVGPMKWLGPSTVEAIRRAGREGKGVLVSPIAFVSEHVETLVELDCEYRDLAQEAGCPAYLRVPALGVTRTFIDELADMVIRAIDREGVASYDGGRRCAAGWSKCPAPI